MIKQENVASASEPHRTEESTSKAESTESTLDSRHGKPNTIALKQHQESTPLQKQLTPIEEENEDSPGRQFETKPKVGIAKPMIKQENVASASEKHRTEESVSKVESTELTLESRHGKPNTIALKQHQESTPLQKQLKRRTKIHQEVQDALISTTLQTNVQEDIPDANSQVRIAKPMIIKENMASAPEPHHTEESVSKAKSTESKLDSKHGKSNTIALKHHQESFPSQKQLTSIEEDNEDSQLGSMRIL
ncbi:uncharacterized protein [Ptychodera flava]|uniref:uncharacterized protein n=1 Tax=Ptychodera flava TaxID=63121 RepID=UPI003969C1FD